MLGVYSVYRNINVNAIVPVLCSSIKREKRPPSPEDDDVIILSDNDSPSPPVNGLSHSKELDTDLLMVSLEKRERKKNMYKMELPS